MRDPIDLPLLPPGLHERTIDDWHDGRPLRYTLSIPDGYPERGPVPLVMALHYRGEVMPFFGRKLLESLIGPGLAKLGAIIGAPDSLELDWTKPPDEEAVLFLTDSALKSYNIDRKRVLIIGYSLGGMGAWHFAGRNADRFTAAVVISGRPRPLAESRIPLYAIHSRDDEMIELTPTRLRIEYLQSKGIDARLVVLSGIGHYETPRFVDALRDAVPWLQQAREGKGFATEITENSEQ